VPAASETTWSIDSGLDIWKRKALPPLSQSVSDVAGDARDTEALIVPLTVACDACANALLERLTVVIACRSGTWMAGLANMLVARALVGIASNTRSGDDNRKRRICSPSLQEAKTDDALRSAEVGRVARHAGAAPDPASAHRRTQVISGSYRSGAGYCIPASPAVRTCACSTAGGPTCPTGGETSWPHPGPVSAVRYRRPAAVGVEGA